MNRTVWARRTRRASIAAAAFLVLIAAAWFTGWPQEKSIEWQIRRNLGAIAVVDWGGLGSDLRFKRIEIYPDRAARRAAAPLLVAEDIRVMYHLSPDDGRMVRSVSVERAQVFLDLIDPEKPNYAFLLEARPEPAPTGDAPMNTQFVPRDLVIEEFGLSVATAQGRGGVTPVRVKADLLKPESPNVVYQSGRAVIAWAPAGRDRVEVKNVTIDGSIALDGDLATFSQKLDAPGLAYTLLAGDGDFSGDAPSARIGVSEFALAGSRLPGFLDAIDSPVRFDEFDVETGEARVVFADAPKFTVSGAARIHQPSMAAAAEPLYANVARLEFDAEQAAAFSANVTLRLAQDQVLRATMTGTDRSGSAEVTSGTWTRDQLMGALPEAFRSGLGGLGFDTFTADANVEWTDERFVARANASSQGGGSDTPPIHWTLDAQGPRDTFAGIEGTLDARIGERSLTATATYVGEDHYRAEARIETVQLAPWVQLIAGDEAAEGVVGTIEGTVLAEVNGKNAPVDITPDVRLREFTYADLDLEEITLAGTLRYSIETRVLSIPDLHAEAIDGMTMFRLADFSYDAEIERGEGGFTAGANLGILGAAFGAPDLFGSSSAEGRVRIAGPDVFVACTVSSDYAGLGEVLLPYGMEIAGNLEAQYNLDDAAGALVTCSAQIGEGASIELAETKFTLEPLHVTGRQAFESDLQLFVGMGLLQEAKGNLTQDATFTLTDEGMNADWHLVATADGLILPDAAGTAEDARFEAGGTYRDTLQGTGTVRAARITAAGGAVLDAQGPVRLADDRMHITPVTGRLFAGNVVADVDVGVFVEDLPIELTGSFDHVDLAILTDEVQPPNTSLTGTAAGTIAVLYTTRGLQSFTLTASAPDGMSVNRSLVADLLQSDRFLAGVAERVADRAMDRLLGTRPQRPFDSGRLNVYLEEEKIQGTAELLSVKTNEYNGLNLTVNLDMDQSALAEALKLLEESKLGNVDF